MENRLRKIPLGVSSCLAGNRVRYDGRDKPDTYLLNTFSRHFDLQAHCPEVGIGLGVPRPPIRLEGTLASPRAVGVEERSLEVTKPLWLFGEQLAEAEGIFGFVFKSRSPSCGLNDVPIKLDSGQTVDTGSGIFAASLKGHRPLLPVIDELDLGIPARREAFVQQVRAYHDWVSLGGAAADKAVVMAFHQGYRLWLEVIEPGRYFKLSDMISNESDSAKGTVSERYIAKLLELLSRPAERAQHQTVIWHTMVEYALPQKSRLLEHYLDYRLPRSSLVALLSDHVNGANEEVPQRYLSMDWTLFYAD